MARILTAEDLINVQPPSSSTQPSSTHQRLPLSSPSSPQRNSNMTAPSPLESDEYTPDASRNPPEPPRRLNRRSSLSGNAFDLTSPLTRTRTPDEPQSASNILDPKAPTYGPTVDGRSSVVSAAGEDVGQVGQKVLVAWDVTPDAGIAYEHVLAKMAFTPSSHIFLTTILPSASSYPSDSSGADSAVSTSTASTPPPIPTATNHNLNHHSHTDGPIPIRQARETALERLQVAAETLAKAKACRVTPVIVHSSSPAKQICNVATLLQVDLIVLGRRRLGRLQKVVGAGSVGSACIEKGWNVQIVQRV